MTERHQQTGNGTKKMRNSNEFLCWFLEANLLWLFTMRLFRRVYNNTHTLWLFKFATFFASLFPLYAVQCFFSAGQSGVLVIYRFSINFPVFFFPYFLRSHYWVFSYLVRRIIFAEVLPPHGGSQSDICFIKTKCDPADCRHIQTLIFAHGIQMKLLYPIQTQT